MESMMQTPGFALFITGLLGMLLAASWMLRNWVAGVSWAFSTITLVFVGVFGVGMELFWLTVTATLLMLIVGMVVRWSL